MECPELVVPLIGRAACSLGCIPAFLAEKREVHVTKLNKTFIDEILFNLTPRASGEMPAVRSLIVGELNHTDWRGRIADPVAHHLRRFIHHALWIVVSILEKQINRFLLCLLTGSRWLR